MAGFWRRQRDFLVGLLAFVATGGVLILTAPPAQAQFSDSYTFLKGVRDRDGSKVQPLLDKPASVIINTRDPATGETALHIVVRGRDDVWTRVMLGRGADVNARDNQGETSLMAAVRIGWLEGADLLLRQRANVDLANGRGETPLIAATQARNLPMVRLLLSRGADPRRPDRATGLSARDYASRDARSASILRAMDEAKPVATKPVAGPTL